MKLKTLSARSFKGLNFSLDLKDINFLVGSNMSGKTARTDAITFLLLGFLPELGKTNVATFGLASGREMVVEGTFDNGLTIRRRRYLEGNSVKTDDTVPKQIEDAGQLAVMLNAETYFALSDRERVNYVFANVAMGPDWTRPAIIERATAALPNDTNDTNIKIASRLVYLATQEDTTVQTFVEDALAWLTTEAKAAKEYATRMDKTTQGLAALKAQDPAALARSMADLDTDRTKILADIDTLKTEKADLQASYNAILAAKKRRDVIESQPRALPRFREQLEALKYRLGQKETLLKDSPTVDGSAIDEKFQEERDASNALTRHEVDAATIRTAKNTNEAELRSFEAMTACPCCGATGEDWKAKKTAEINSAVAGLRTKEAQVTEHIDKLRTAITAIRKGRLQIQDTQTKQVTTEREIAQIRQEIATTEKQIAQLEGFAAELANMPVNDPEIVAKVETLQSAINVANSHLGSNDRMKADAIGRQSDAKRLAEAEGERMKAKADLEVYVTAGKKLREIQGEMVQAAFTPLLATANSFFADVLKTPIAYSHGEIGTWRDGVWVTHRTLSGTEKLLTYAAIQAALSSKSPVRIMILDELGRLDTANVGVVAASIAVAVKSGLIDQGVVIDATNRFPTPDKNSQVVTIE